MNGTRTGLHLTLLALMLALAGCGGGGGGGGNNAPNPPPPNSPPPPPPPAGTNANLSSLTLEGVTLDPAFDPATLAYTADVAFLVRGALLEANPEDAAASVRVDATDVGAGIDIAFAENDNAIDIDVTAEDGTTTQTYVVTVTRESGVGQRLRGTGEERAVYRINETNGEMIVEAGRGLEGFNDLEGLAYDAQNNVYYGSMLVDDTLLRIDAATGLTSTIGSTGFDGVAALAYDNDANVLYGIDDDTDQLLTINTTTGAATVVGPVGNNIGSIDTTSIRSLAYDSTQQRLIGVNNVLDFSVSIDAGTGTTTELRRIDFERVEGMAYDSASDTVYGIDDDSNRLVTFDVQGNATVAGSLKPRNGKGLAYNSALETLIASDTSTKGIYNLNRETSSGVVVGDLGVADVYGLAARGAIVYGVDPVRDMLMEIDENTGAATDIGPLGFDEVRDIAYDSNSNTLYGTDFDSKNLISINRSTGAGTAIGNKGLGDTIVVGLGYDTSTDTLYGATAGDDLVSIDTTNGEPTVVGPIGFTTVRGLAYDPESDTLYGSDNATDQLLVIDRQSGAGTAVSTWDFDTVRGLTFVDFGVRDTLYAADDVGDQLVAIPPVGEIETAVGFADIGASAYDPTTNTLYATDRGNDTLLSIDTTTGVGTPIGPLGFGSVAGLAYDSVNDLLYGIDSGANALITIDRSTGAGTRVASIDPDPIFTALAFDEGSGTLYSHSFIGQVIVSIDVTTGIATDIGSVGIGAVSGMTFDGSGTLWGATINNQQLVTIDTATGAGTAVGDIEGELFDRLHGLAYDPSTDTLFGVTDFGSGETIDHVTSLVRVDRDTADITFIDGFGFDGSEALAFESQSGLLYGVESDTDLLITVQPVDQSSTTVDPIGVTTIVGLTHDVNGDRLFGTDGSQLFLIDRAAATGTFLGTIGFTDVSALAFDRATDTLYAADTALDQLLTLNPANGAATVVGPFDGPFAFGDVVALAFDPVGGTLYAGTSEQRLASIDTSTGEATEIATMENRINGLAAIE